MNEEIVKRNFTTLADGLNQQRDLNSTQDDKIQMLEAKVTELESKVTALNSKVAALLIGRMGTGPTSV